MGECKIIHYTRTANKLLKLQLELGEVSNHQNKEVSMGIIMVSLIIIQRMLYIEWTAVVSMIPLTRYNKGFTLNVMVVEPEYHEWDIYSREAI